MHTMRLLDVCQRAWNTSHWKWEVGVTERRAWWGCAVTAVAVAAAAAAAYVCCAAGFDAALASDDLEGLSGVCSLMAYTTVRLK